MWPGQIVLCSNILELCCARIYLNNTGILHQSKVLNNYMQQLYICNRIRKGVQTVWIKKSIGWSYLQTKIFLEIHRSPMLNVYFRTLWGYWRGQHTLNLEKKDCSANLLAQMQNRSRLSTKENKSGSTSSERIGRHTLVNLFAYTQTDQN